MNRKNLLSLLEMLEDGVLDYKTVVEATLSYISEEDLERLMRIYGWREEEN